MLISLIAQSQRLQRFWSESHPTHGGRRMDSLYSTVQSDTKTTLNKKCLKPCITKFRILVETSICTTGLLDKTKFNFSLV